MLNTGLLVRKIYRLVKSGSVHSRPYLVYRRHLAQSAPWFSRALFNLTVDLELGWSRARRGQGATGLAESLRRSRLARMIFPDFLSLADQYGIPVTFAVVGHLAVADCSSHNLPPPFQPYWFGEDWFAADPDSGLVESPDYYGPDLLERILLSPTAHEIASHTFSHIDLADDATTKEIARFEIAESRRLLEKFDDNLTTFVFPNNAPGFKEHLKRQGFKIYRTGGNHSLKRDDLGLWQFPVGLWLSPQSFSADEIIALLLIAAKRKCLINFFCHLYEFTGRRQLVNFFQPVFSCIKRSQEQGTLSALTVRDIVKSADESDL